MVTLKSQELLKEIEKLCAKLVQNYEEWNKEEGEWERKVNEKYGLAPMDKKSENEGERIKKKYLRIRSEIYREIKEQILKDLTLWELDVEGNIQSIPEVSVNTLGAKGGYILFGYRHDINFIHFFSEEPNKNYKREITRAFVEEIKQNPQDWEIILEATRDKPFEPKPMVANPEDCQVVKHKSGRRHKRGYQWYNDFKPGFSDGEWKEVENALNKKKPESLEQQKEDQIIKQGEVIKNLKKIINQPQTNNLDQEREALLKKVQQLKTENKQEELIKQNNRLKEVIKELETEIDRLKAEIQELKKENDNSPEHQSYLAEKKTEVQSKQQKLEQLKGIIKVDNSEQKPKPDNFPTGLVVGGGLLLVVLVVVAIRLVVKKQKVK